MGLKWGSNGIKMGLQWGYRSHLPRSIEGHYSSHRKWRIPEVKVAVNHVRMEWTLRVTALELR